MSTSSLFARALAVNATSEAAQLYAAANTQFSELTLLEQWWAAWYLWIGNPTIATGLMSFAIHEVSSSTSCFGNDYQLLLLCRSCTLADAFPGLSLTQFHTLESGSSSLSDAILSSRCHSIFLH